MTLANKYRPRTFDDMVEQKVVVDIVRSICEKSELANRNFLFVGAAGLGKTTLCRIIANELNEGKGSPIEIDAASNGTVDAVRKIVDQARAYPVGTKYKVFIIDEAHAVTPAGWSSFLKCIEESPAKSVFLFATTNPEKIPATILSRVQVFQLAKISLAGIHDRLKFVLDSEIAEGRDIHYSDDSITFLAKLANGGMRDALTLLDKALAYSSDVTAENVSAALNLPNYDDYFRLLSSYAKHDNRAIADIVDRVYNSGVNFVKWFEGFHSFVIQILKYIYLQDIGSTTIPPQYQDKIVNYNIRHANICLKLANILIKLNDTLRRTSYLQEFALTYLCSINKEAK
jgi:DNA polymerase-3 subunit gamma/tau